MERPSDLASDARTSNGVRSVEPRRGDVVLSGIQRLSNLGLEVRFPEQGRYLLIRSGETWEITEEEGSSVRRFYCSARAVPGADHLVQSGLARLAEEWSVRGVTVQHSELLDTSVAPPRARLLLSGPERDVSVVLFGTAEILVVVEVHGSDVENSGLLRSLSYSSTVFPATEAIDSSGSVRSDRLDLRTTLPSSWLRLPSEPGSDALVWLFGGSDEEPAPVFRIVSSPAPIPSLETAARHLSEQAAAAGAIAELDEGRFRGIPAVSYRFGGTQSLRQGICLRHRSGHLVCLDLQDATRQEGSLFDAVLGEVELDRDAYTVSP